MPGYRRYEELTGCVPDEMRDAPGLPTMTLHAFGVALEVEPQRIRLAWTGFFTLIHRRQWTMNGAGPIPLFEIRGWLDEQRIHDPDDRADLIDLIDRMDQEYMNRVNNSKET